MLLINVIYSPFQRSMHTIFRRIGIGRFAANLRHVWTANMVDDATEAKLTEKQLLMQLSKEELIEKVIKLEKDRDAWKSKASQSRRPVSKFEALKQKFDRMDQLIGKRKKRRPFVPQLSGRRKIALKILYFGWEYDGLQDNPNIDDSIEKIILEALRRTRLLVDDLDQCEYTRCGRTDKGVSAFSQVLCLKLRSKLMKAPSNSEDSASEEMETNGSHDQGLVNTDDSARFRCGEAGEAEEDKPAEDNLVSHDASGDEFDYCGILNRVLPNEIQALAWAPADEEFSSRRSCVGRQYRYFFPRGVLDIDKMQEAARYFEGEHDHRNFCKMNVEETTNFVRLIRSFEIRHADSDTETASEYRMCTAIINGTGFLYHQVRNMMAVLFLVGMGLEDPDVVKQLLDVEKNPNKPQYGMMADFPLVLYKCQFEGLRWTTSPDVSLKLHSFLQRFWSELAIKCALAKSMLQKHIEEDPNTAAYLKKPSDPQPLSMADIKNYDLNGYLLSEKWSSKGYRKLLKRERGQSLEEKVSNMENRKRRRLEREAADAVEQ